MKPEVEKKQWQNYIGVLHQPHIPCWIPSVVYFLEDSMLNIDMHFMINIFSIMNLAGSSEFPWIVSWVQSVRTTLIYCSKAFSALLSPWHSLMLSLLLALFTLARLALGQVACVQLENTTNTELFCFRVSDPTQNYSYYFTGKFFDFDAGDSNVCWVSSNQSHIETGCWYGILQQFYFFYRNGSTVFPKPYVDLLEPRVFVTPYNVITAYATTSIDLALDFWPSYSYTLTNMNISGITFKASTFAENFYLMAKDDKKFAIISVTSLVPRYDRHFVFSNFPLVIEEH